VRTQQIGFNNENATESNKKENLYKYVSPQDIKSFGLIPELVGRLPALTYLEPLDAPILSMILTQPKNALVKQYKKLFEMENIDLTFTDEALEFIVNNALELKLGARGLRSICENIMTDAMFELPSETNVKSFTVDLAYAQSKLSKDKLKMLKVAG
jgi:ATP-dependent Clp protease ATP-binding subunit ClpX